MNHIPCEIHTINTKSINIVLLDQRLNPVAVRRYNRWVFGLHIRKRDVRIAQPAGLFTCSVAPINGAI